jgi:hypothetical protein
MFNPTSYNFVQLRTTSYNFVLMFFSFFLVSSCQSERIDLPTATSETAKTADAKTPYFNQQVEKNYDAAAEKAIKGRIQNFSDLLKRAENQSLPENSTMNESDVVWNVEALLNSRYGWADKPFSSQITEKDVVIIPRNADGSVDVAALPAAIEQARLKVAARYEAVSGNKHIIAIDIEPKTIESGNLGLEIETVIGEEAAAAAPGASLFDPFGPGDDWKYNNGRCDGTMNGLNLNSELTREVNARRPLPQGHLYFTNITSTPMAFTYEFPNPNDLVPNDNNRDHLMFSMGESLPNYRECIVSDDINFYFNNFLNVIVPAKKPANKFFSYCNIQLDFVGGCSPCYFTHVAFMTYASAVRCNYYIPCGPGPGQCLMCDQ